MATRKINLRVVFEVSIHPKKGARKEEEEDDNKEPLRHVPKTTVYHAGRIIDGTKPLSKLLQKGEVAVVSVIRRTLAVNEFKNPKVPMFVTGRVVTSHADKILTKPTHTGVFEFPLATGMASTIPDPMCALPDVWDLTGFDDSSTKDLGAYLKEYFGPCDTKHAGTDLSVDDTEKQRNKSASADGRLLVLDRATDLTFDVRDSRAGARAEAYALDGFEMGMIADITLEVFRVTDDAEPVQE